MEAVHISGSDFSKAISKFNVIGGEDRERHAIGPELKGMPKRYLWRLLRLIGLVLGVIGKGVRVVWESSLRASEAHNRQMTMLDDRYPNARFLR